MHDQDAPADHDRPRKAITWAICGLLAIAAGLLILDRGVNVPGALPYLFLLACPLMHVMHRGHGHRHSKSDKAHAEVGEKQK